MTTKNKIEYKKFFNQILSSLKEILLKGVKAPRASHEKENEKKDEVKGNRK